MKKQLIAAAVATAFAIPAMAQNVSITGYLEAAVAATNNDAAATADTQTVGNGLLGSPRLIISGSEDLGGGLKAGFRVESSLSPSTGAAGSTGAGPDVLFNRGAEVNLSGAFGMVRIGKFDHQGGENTDGVSAVVGNSALMVGSRSGANNDGPVGVEMGSDRDGTIAYRTPTIAGGYVEIAHTQKNQITSGVSGNGADAAVSLTAANTTTAATHTAQGALTSFYYQGTVNGLDIRVGYASQDKVTEAVDASRYGFSLAYDFGAAQVGVQYAKLSNLTNVDNKETALGVKVPLGNGFDVRALYKRFDSAGTTADDFKRLDLIAVKTLSKRTNVYAAYSNFDAGVGAATTNLGGVDRSIMYLGASHSF